MNLEEKLNNACKRAKNWSIVSVVIVVLEFFWSIWQLIMIDIRLAPTV